MVLLSLNTKLWGSKEECYNFFFKKKTKELAIQYDKIVSYYRHNYSFLTNEQIQGKVYNHLNVPNVCGKINRKKLRELIKEENKLKKSSKKGKLSSCKKRNKKDDKVGVDDSDANIRHMTKLYSRNSDSNSTIDTFMFTPESYDSNPLAIRQMDHCDEVQRRLSQLKIKSTSSGVSEEDEFLSHESIYDPTKYAISDENYNKKHLNTNTAEENLFTDNMVKHAKPMRTYSRVNVKNTRSSISGIIYKTDSDLEVDLYCKNSKIDDDDDSSLIYSGELYIDKKQGIISTSCYSSSNESSSTTIKNTFNSIEKGIKLNFENEGILQFLRNSNDEPISQAKNILDILTSCSSPEHGGYSSDISVISHNKHILNLNKQVANIINGSSDSELAFSDTDIDNKHDYLHDGDNHSIDRNTKNIIGTTDEEDWINFKPFKSSVSPIIFIEKDEAKTNSQGRQLKRERKGRISKLKTTKHQFSTNLRSTERSSVARLGTMYSTNKLENAKKKLLNRRSFYLK
ncbi:uncharacterized protein LOC106661532 isoform X2 [Cimex lectularius]|uniref:Uncharacterized protein n=1 Tax=Cimex lectularius TaxID=79782 RepID=A0A8I6TMK1_CIMLE|nr:uncharacterized protein LOC106661532 isoform X2 [Cimex lectularius]